MTFLEKIRKMTIKGVKDKDKKRMKLSKKEIPVINKKIKYSARDGSNHVRIVIDANDYNIEYLIQYYLNKGFSVNQSYCRKGDFIIHW